MKNHEVQNRQDSSMKSTGSPVGKENGGGRGKKTCRRICGEHGNGDERMQSGGEKCLLRYWSPDKIEGRGNFVNLRRGSSLFGRERVGKESSGCKEGLFVQEILSKQSALPDSTLGQRERKGKEKNMRLYSVKASKRRSKAQKPQKARLRDMTKVRENC